MSDHSLRTLVLALLRKTNTPFMGSGRIQQWDGQKSALFRDGCDLQILRADELARQSAGNKSWKFLEAVGTSTERSTDCLNAKSTRSTWCFCLANPAQETFFPSLRLALAYPALPYKACDQNQDVHFRIREHVVVCARHPPNEALSPPWKNPASADRCNFQTAHAVRLRVP
jgi:hypothetical protein